MFIVNAVFLGLGANKPWDLRGNVMEGQCKLSLFLTFLAFSPRFFSSFTSQRMWSMSGAGRNASCVLLPSILHLPLALLLKVLWGLSLNFALCVCYALILQAAVELLTLPCTDMEAGRPHVSQDRTISPPYCWPEDPVRLGTFKSHLPRFFFPHGESSPELIFEGIMLLYEVAFCGYLWTMVVDIRCFLDLSPFCMAQV